MQNSIYKIKYLLFLSWDWEAWCLTVWGVITPCLGGNNPPSRKKCFHCLGAPNNLIRPWLNVLDFCRLVSADGASSAVSCASNWNVLSYHCQGLGSRRYRAVWGPCPILGVRSDGSSQSGHPACRHLPHAVRAPCCCRSECPSPGNWRWRRRVLSKRRELFIQRRIATFQQLGMTGYCPAEVLNTRISMQFFVKLH